MPKESLAIVEPKPLAELDTKDAVRMIEDRVLNKAVGIVEAFMLGAEVGPEDEAPPPEWKARFGSQKEANRLFRMAKAAWMSQKEAPMMAKMAKEILVGVVKARALEKAGPRKLSLNVTTIDFKLPEFPTVKVEK